MSKNTKKILTGFSMALATISVVAFLGGIREVGVKADVNLNMPLELSDTYQLGDSFSVPSAKFTLNGAEYDTDFIIVYPDGGIYEDAENVLNVLGKYTIVYSAEIDGKLYKEEKTFQTVQGLYQVGEGSLIEYTDALAMSPSENIQGLHIRLKEGDEFIYNQPINLFETKEFIKFYPYNNNTVESASEHTFDAKRIVFRLTDCYNENIYVEYEVDFYSGIGGAAYYRGGSSTQKMVGLTAESKAAVAPRREVFIDGIRYLAKYEDDYGTETGTKIYQDIGITFSYDLNTNDMSAEDKKQRLINNLSNPDIYSEINLFEGFTTGEVYLSIRGDEYYGDEMNLDIPYIGDRAGEELIGMDITDTVAPVIKIDCQSDVDEIKIARGEGFKLLPASAYDIHLKGGVRTRVYYNYGKENSQQIGIVDGAFIPNRLGEYTIVYEAMDFVGNKAQELMVLQCVETESGKSVQFEFSEIQNVEAGETIRLDYSLKGLNGEAWLNAYAKHESGEKVVIDCVDSDFIFKKTGTWTLCFEYGDAFSSYTYQCEVTCLPSDNVVYLQKFVLPEYFIHNVTYSFEEIFAYTFEGAEPTLNKTTLLVSEDGKPYQPTTFDKYVVGAEKSVQFKVEYAGAVLESEIISVVEVGFGTNELNIEEYFVGGDFKKTVANNLIEFASNIKSGTNEMTFVNAVSLDSFAIDFQIPSEAADCIGVEFTLIDYYDRNNQTTVSYRNQNGIISFECDGNATVINKAFVGVWHNISYDRTKKAFIDTNGIENAFLNTFVSDKIIVRIALTDISGDAAIQIKRFNQQPINNSKKDTTAPQILVDAYSGIYSFDETVKIFAASATDVLSPVLESSLKVTVKDPNGDVVTALDGTILNDVIANKDYEIRLMLIGSYTVLYTVEDQSGRYSEGTITLIVQKSNAPTLSLSDGYDENTVVYVSKGKTLKVASYQVKDDIDANVKVFIVVYTPDMTFEIIGESGAFKASLQGEYTVYYYAYDNVGNYTSTYYTVKVA